MVPPGRMSDYLGFVRLGAGPGCPCAAEVSWRLIQAAKSGQGWPYFTGPGSGLRFRTLTLDGAAFGAAAGPRTIDRLTGLSSGTRYTDWAGIARTNDLRTRQLVVRGQESAPGAILLSDPYDLATLHQDCATIFDDPAAHPILVPPSGYYAAARAEVETSSGLNPISDPMPPRHFAGDPECIPWANLPGPVDGRVIVNPTAGIGSVKGITTDGRSTWQIWSAAIGGRIYYLHRLWITGHRGFYSRSDTFRTFNPFGGGPGAVILDLGKRYYRHRGGPLDIRSLPIAETYGPTTDGEQIYAVSVIQLGDAPPPPGDYLDTGTDGLAASC